MYSTPPKTNLTILFFFFLTSLFGQENIKIFHEPIPHGYAIYAENSEYCPVTVVLDLELDNMRTKSGQTLLFVIDPLEKKKLLTEITTIVKTRPSKFKYNYTFNLGATEQLTYDHDFEYFLPFEKNSAHFLYQGYNGSLSHVNENALDFVMPVGTPITSMRDGIVVKIEDTHNQVCTEKDCAKYNNFIIIYHSDGTFAEYTHLKEKGTLVKVGDTVAKGELIGYSGNTGWSTGAHLHVMVYLQRMKFRETLKTKFKVQDGSKSEYLEERVNYSRNY